MTKKLVAACFANGLIAERVGRDNNVLKLMPPLVIEVRDIVIQERGNILSVVKIEVQIQFFFHPTV